MENLDSVLAAYQEIPMRDGDVALFTDLKVVQEVEGLADHWDARLRSTIADILRDVGATELVMAIARTDAQLRATDHAMWADLREELLGSVHVAPVVALPAA